MVDETDSRHRGARHSCKTPSVRMQEHEHDLQAPPLITAIFGSFIYLNLDLHKVGLSQITVDLSDALFFSRLSACHHLLESSAPRRQFERLYNTSRPIAFSSFIYRTIKDESNHQLV